MANYYCTTRSNYVKVDEPDAYTGAVHAMGFETWTREDPEHGTLVAFGDSTGELSLDGHTWDEHGNETEWSVADLAPHLADGWVLTVETVGAEKLRYVNAAAVAVARGQEPRWFHLGSLLDAAAHQMGERVTEGAY